MTINWWTIALQAINFLVLVWLLQRFLYKPALAVMARRKQLVEEAFSKAEELKTEAETEQRRYEAETEKLAETRKSVLARAHAEIDADRARVLEKAQEQVAAMLDDARAQITEERAAALDAIKTEVADLSVSLASRLLEQLTAEPGTGSIVNDASLTALLAHVDALPEDECRSLKEDLVGTTEGLTVLTAHPLEAEAQQRWRAELEKRLGRIEALSFQARPELLGGVELRFPHAVVSLAWSEQLKQSRKSLLAHDVPH
jgi:ATP synthase F0 subunit b